MTKPCQVCRQDFEAKRPAAKYCSTKCRQRAYRQPTLRVVQIDGNGQETAPESTEGPVSAATRADLLAGKRLDTALGQIAMSLALRIDQSSHESGSSLAAVARQLRDTLSAALEGVESAEDPLVRIRGNALRVIAG